MGTSHNRMHCIEKSNNISKISTMTAALSYLWYSSYNMGPYQILADIYRAWLLTPEIIVILFTLKMQLVYGTHHTTWGHIRDRIGGPVSSRSNLAPSVMTKYQCGWSLHKNFRSLHKNFQEDHLNSRISRRVFKFQEISRISRSCRVASQYVGTNE